MNKNIPKYDRQTLASLSDSELRGELNKKQLAYVDAYQGDEREAFLAAGYGDNSHRQGEVRSHPIVTELISRRYREEGMSADEIIAHICRLVRASPVDCFKPVLNEHGKPVIQNGRAVHVLDWERLKTDKGLAAAIASIKATRYGWEVKMHDKAKALDMLARHLGLYEADTRPQPTESKIMLLLGKLAEQEEQ